MATLRFFDAVVDTYDQFAMWNLVGRNFCGIATVGKERGWEDAKDIARR